MIITVCRKAHFNAAHRLHNPSWDDATNRKVFGVCNSPNFHGHNYDLEVKLTGPINAETGYLYDLKELADLINDEIEERFDHKNLNLDCPEFSNLNPTAENIAVVIWNLLRAKVPQNIELSVTLYETPKNYVEYKG